MLLLLLLLLLVVVVVMVLLLLLLFFRRLDHLDPIFCCFNPYVLMVESVEISIFHGLNPQFFMIIPLLDPKKQGPMSALLQPMLGK